MHLGRQIDLLGPPWQRHTKAGQDGPDHSSIPWSDFRQAMENWDVISLPSFFSSGKIMMNPLQIFFSRKKAGMAAIAARDQADYWLAAEPRWLYCVTDFSFFVILGVRMNESRRPCHCLPFA